MNPSATERNSAPPSLKPSRARESSILLARAANLKRIALRRDARRGNFAAQPDGVCGCRLRQPAQDRQLCAQRVPFSAGGQNAPAGLLGQRQRLLCNQSGHGRRPRKRVFGSSRQLARSEQRRLRRVHLGDDVGQESTYAYDEFNRLTGQSTVSGATQNMTWTYDRWGNRTSQTATNGPQPSFSFNTGSNQISGYTYDAAGNLINDGIHSYSYDAEGNLTAVDGGQTATYVYDALNHRVREVVGSAATELVFNAGGQRVSTWNGSTGVQTQGQYYWGGKPVAYYAGGSTHFQHQDWVGTERLRTTYNGSVESAFQSLPFGDSQSSSGTNGDAYRFAMLDHDSEDSSEHAQFRQYSSTQARWMAPDPYGGSYNPSNPQSFNRYVYAMNNPLTFVDPLGLCVTIREDGTIGDDGTGPNGPDCSVTVTADPSTPCYADASCQPSQPAGQQPYCWLWGNCGSGNRGGGAPNKTPWYKNPCVQSALAKGAASTALDAIGTLPEGGTVAAAFSLWHGAAGVSNGNKILGRVAFAGGLISTAGASHDLQEPQESTLSTTVTGLQVAAGGAGIAKGLIEDIPVAGQVFAAVSVGLDILGTGVEVYNCHP